MTGRPQLLTPAQVRRVVALHRMDVPLARIAGLLEVLPEVVARSFRTTPSAGLPLLSRVPRWAGPDDVLPIEVSQ